LRISIRPLAFLVILTFSWGCSLVRPPSWRPSIPFSPLIEAVRLSNERIRSLRGIARIELVYQGKRFRARQAIALAKPGLMRLETLGLLNQPLLILATDGVTLQALSISENRFYEGTVSGGLSHFMHLRTNSEEFVSLILGSIPLREDGSLRYDAYRSLYQLTFPPSTRWETQTFWIHPKTLRVLEILKTDALNGEEIRISFGRFRKAGSVTFPMEIDIEVPAADNRIRLRFRRVEVNPSLSQDLFRLSTPPGVEIVAIDQDMGRFPAPSKLQEHGGQ